MSSPKGLARIAGLLYLIVGIFGLGVVLIVGGVSYLVDMLVAFLVPDLSRQIHGVLAIPPAIAEIGMVGYLLWIGLRPSAPSDRAPRRG